MCMIINEIFSSIQGEGRLAGIPSLFIRVAGCPLRCRWCDTDYAWGSSAGKELSIQQIANRIRQSNLKHLVITGGEPLEQKQLKDLLNRISSESLHVTIETSALQYISGLKCDLMSISPKLSNSIPDSSFAKIHDQNRLNLSAIRQMMASYDYQLKFVIDQSDDMTEVHEFLSAIGKYDKEKVYLMPQAKDRQEYIEKSFWLCELCVKEDFCFSQRLQVLLWEAEKGK